MHSSSQEDSRGPPASSTCPLSEDVLSAQGVAVLDLLWLADPAKSRCPPIRHTMLQILEVRRGIRVSGGGGIDFLPKVVRIMADGGREGVC